MQVYTVKYYEAGNEMTATANFMFDLSNICDNLDQNENVCDSTVTITTRKEVE